MTGLDFRRHGGLWRFGIVEQQRHIVVQGLLIRFQRQSIVALLLDDLRGDGPLAVQRIRGDDAPLQAEHTQQLWHCGDFIRLGIGGDLRQNQPLFRIPGRDHVQGRLAAGRVERTAQHLAVDGDHTLQTGRRIVP